LPLFQKKQKFGRVSNLLHTEICSWPHEAAPASLPPEAGLFQLRRRIENVVNLSWVPAPSQLTKNTMMLLVDPASYLPANKLTIKCNLSSRNFDAIMASRASEGFWEVSFLVLV
jgi:hypothetical protein